MSRVSPSLAYRAGGPQGGAQRTSLGKRQGARVQKDCEELMTQRRGGAHVESWTWELFGTFEDWSAMS